MFVLEMDVRKCLCFDRWKIPTLLHHEPPEITFDLSRNACRELVWDFTAIRAPILALGLTLAIHILFRSSQGYIVPGIHDHEWSDLVDPNLIQVNAVLPR